MRKIFILVLSGIFVAGVVSSSFRTAQAQGEEEVVLEAVEVGNRICPVSGKEIKEEEKYQVEYEGKIYNLCCKACAKDFKKDPQEYIEKLKELEEKEGHHHEGHHHTH